MKNLERNVLIGVVASILIAMITGAGYYIYLEDQIRQAENRIKENERKVKLSRSVEYFIYHSELKNKYLTK